LDKIYDRSSDIGFHWVRTSIERSGNANESDGSTNHPEKYSYSSIGYTFRIDRTGQWAWHFDMQNRFAGDLIVYMIIAFKDLDGSVPEKARYSNNHLSNGFLGELNLGRNIIGSDRLVVSAGLNIADHWLKNEGREKDSEDEKDINVPDGYYFSLGAYAHADFAVISGVAARITVSAAKAVAYHRAGDAKTNSKPLFVSIQPEIITSLGFFAGVDIFQPVHDYGVKQKRFDIKLGFRF
jgi:hypothetical protein